MLHALFLGIAMLSVILLYLALTKDARVLWYFLPWMTLVGALSYLGYFQNTSAMPPRAMFVIGPGVLSVLFFISVTRKTPVKTNYLLAIHALRLPVELVLHQLYVVGKVPIIMTFLGWNFDIVMGISAVGLLLYSGLSNGAINPILYKVWNVVGLLFLVVIVSVAILSAPLPFQQLAFNQPNIAILEFPYTYLPAVVVPIVFIAHILGLRQGVVAKR